MPNNEYHFVDRWRVEGTVEEVSEVIEDAVGLVRWWPSVYFEVEEKEKGGEGGVGKLISLRAGGWLPYTLHINFLTTESRSPHGFTLQASGDLEGTGVWSFEQDGQFVNYHLRLARPGQQGGSARPVVSFETDLRLQSSLDHAARRREP